MSGTLVAVFMRSEDAIPFTRQDRPAPRSFKTSRLLVRPLMASDAEADFAALMESREDVRRSSQSSWPADDFTIEQNRNDLARHQAEHEAGDAFTYTVMDPEEMSCLGCIYMVPLPFHLMRVGAADELVESAAWDAAAVYFWVRSPRLPSGLEAELLREIRDWMAREKAFSRVLYSTHSKDPRQVALLEAAGFQVVIRSPNNERYVEYFYYEAP